MVEKRNIRVLAQDIMDLYHQDFIDDNEEHFELDFFVRQAERAYAFLLNEEYKRLYEIARRDGVAHVDLISFDAQWLKREKVKIEKDNETGWFLAKTSQKPFVFIYDKSSVGVQDVVSNECELVRSTFDRSWIRKKHLPETTVTFWWLDTEGIAFDKDCCKEVFVYYIPAASGDLEIAKEKEFEIQTMVYNLMAQARNGSVINTTNDSNANAIQQTEVNKQALK